MKIPLLLRFLAAVLALTTFVPAARTEGTNATPPVTPALAEFQKLITETKSEVTRAESETKASADELTKSAPADRATAQAKLDPLQAKLDAARQKLAALEQAESALREQGPIRLLIVGFKKELDAIPSPGTAAQKVQRAELERKIAELERADLAIKPAPAPVAAEKTGINAVWLLGIAFMVIAVGGLVFGLGYLWTRANGAAKVAADDDAVARVRLAKAVTLGAMTFIVLVSVVTLLFAGINAAVPPQDEKKTALFFDIAKWILGTILPVVGAWVGGVMAYYFGKDNFKVGVENAERLLQQLSPQQKLDAHKAGDKEIGIEISKADKLTLAAGAALESTALTVVRTAFKNRERLPILDSAGHPLACLHLNNLDKYEKGIPEANRSAKSLGDLSAAIGWNPETSFASVTAEHLLSAVQALVSANAECTDVFVTEGGTKNGVVTRWITNQDLVKIVNS